MEQALYILDISDIIEAEIYRRGKAYLKVIRQLLPGVKYVDAGNLNFNPDVIRYADVVWIQRNCISHPQYWSVVKNCKLAGVQMRYFSYASAEKCAEQLVEWDRK